MARPARGVPRAEARPHADHARPERARLQGRQPPPRGRDGRRAAEGPHGAARTRSTTSRSGSRRAPRRKKLTDQQQQARRGADVGQGREGVRHRPGAGGDRATSTAGTRSASRCLLARRLVEAGVPVVQANMGRVQNWDSHGDLFKRMKKRPAAAAGRGRLGAARRPARPRAARRHAGDDARRVRPRAEDQQAGRPRPLGAVLLRAVRRGGRSRRAGDRQERQERRVSRRRRRTRPTTSARRSTRCSASTRTRRSATGSTARCSSTAAASSARCSTGGRLRPIPPCLLRPELPSSRPGVTSSVLDQPGCAPCRRYRCRRGVLASSRSFVSWKLPRLLSSSSSPAQIQDR